MSCTAQTNIPQCENIESKQSLSNRIFSMLKEKFPHIEKCFNKRQIIYLDSFIETSLYSCFNKRGEHIFPAFIGGYKFKLTYVIEDSENLYSNVKRVDWVFGKITNEKEIASTPIII